MKKMLFAASISALMFACSNEKTDTTDTTTSTTTSTSSNNANSSSGYNAGEGDVSYRDGRVMVRRNNNWEAAENDVNLENGIVVHKDGRVERNGKIVELNEGQIVDRTGRFFDKAGNAVENAWQDTKEGVKKGVNEVEEEVKDVMNRRENNN